MVCDKLAGYAGVICVLLWNEQMLRNPSGGRESTCLPVPVLVMFLSVLCCVLVPITAYSVLE
jgi:hypothetical protein